ncbi:hypothetical protein [Pedobacter antarcticus]|uniref:hypothetical protein n=1 Tax=Pedobacter antarcticus TaxID=34086 RepID=UPI002930AE12|nr:hypothetical protein [Pedobacter antarcticus]
MITPVNPAIGSRWTTEKDGKVFSITIDGMWSSGAGENFEVHSYDLKYDHLEQLQNISAERMEQLIREKKLIWQ